MKQRTQTSPAASPVAVGLGTAAVAWGAHALARRLRRIDLRGKVVLITGGSRGLGLVMARRFATLGARVASTATPT